MWPKDYKDYPKDSPLKKERVESGKGIIGCEMHESNGWGTSFHCPRSRTPLKVDRPNVNSETAND